MTVFLHYRLYDQNFIFDYCVHTFVSTAFNFIAINILKMEILFHILWYDKKQTMTKQTAKTRMLLLTCDKIYDNRHSIWPIVYQSIFEVVRSSLWSTKNVWFIRLIRNISRYSATASCKLRYAFYSEDTSFGLIN